MGGTTSNTLIRFLRQDNGSIWIWTKQLAERNDMVEVYAKNVEEAKKASAIPLSDRITETHLREMTRAMLMGYMWDRFMIKLHADLPHEKMVELILENIDKERAAANEANMSKPVETNANQQTT